MYFLTREDDAYIQLIHDVFTYHITPHTMRTNQLNFLSSIVVWGPRPYKWWHNNLLLLLCCGRILLRVPPVKSYQALRQRKKNSRWTETEEKILIELFCDNKEKLRYKAYNSPEWESIATQLHERCRREYVSSDKTAQQCKTKMSNLTKKFKTAKDKLRTTGYGKGGDEEADKEAEGGVELVSEHFQDMDEILGKREVINPQHVLESSSPRSNHRVP